MPTLSSDKPGDWSGTWRIWAYQPHLENKTYGGWVAPADIQLEEISKPDPSAGVDYIVKGTYDGGHLESDYSDRTKFMGRWYDTTPGHWLWDFIKSPRCSPISQGSISLEKKMPDNKELQDKMLRNNDYSFGSYAPEDFFWGKIEICEDDYRELWGHRISQDQSGQSKPEFGTQAGLGTGTQTGQRESGTETQTGLEITTPQGTTTLNPSEAGQIELIPGQKAEINVKCNEVKTALALIIAVESESKEYRNAYMYAQLYQIVNNICERLKSGKPTSLQKTAKFADASSSIATDYPVKLQLDLRQGSIKPEVINDQLALAVGTPTATVSSLGVNTFGVALDPASGKSIISAYQNSIEVQPKNSNLAPFTLGTGQKVEITQNNVGPIISMGQTPTGTINERSTYVSPDGKDIYGPTGVPGNGGNTIGATTSDPTNPLGQGSALQLLDHTMASQVDESTYEAVTRTSTFQPWDRRAYSWISLGNINRGQKVDWNWYAPDGSLYDDFSQNIPEPGDKPWKSYNLYAYIDIAGDQSANMPGTWHVDILLDGQKILTEQFTLLAGNSEGMGTDIFGPTGNKGRDSSGSGEMHGGCYTDPSTGQIICVDYFGNPSGSGMDQGNQQTTQTPSGGCYQDPLTGEVKCIDLTGEPEDLSAPKRGCFTDPSTGETTCID
jgi:hypothetical protein